MLTRGLVALLLILGCSGGDSRELVLQLRTDFVSGLEFDEIEVVLDEESARVPQRMYQDSTREVLFLGNRSLPIDTYLVEVRLLYKERLVSSASVSVLLNPQNPSDVTVVTIPIQRTCNLECTSGQTCFRGACIRSECAVEDPPPSCTLTLECGEASDCAMPESECLNSVCLAGTCYERQSLRCESNEVCVPGDGCVLQPCGTDEFVQGGNCVACPSGTKNEPGDDPNGMDTSCDPCAGGVCCEPGEVRACVTDGGCGGEQTCSTAGFSTCVSSSEMDYYRDADGDGFGNSDVVRTLCASDGMEVDDGWVSTGGDCNDEDNTVRPGAVDVCGVDRDCDESTDPWSNCLVCEGADCACQERRIGGATMFLCEHEVNKQEAIMYCERLGQMRELGETIELATVDTEALDSAIDSWMEEAIWGESANSTFPPGGAYMRLTCQRDGVPANCSWDRDGSPVNFQDFSRVGNCNEPDNSDGLIGRDHEASGKPECNTTQRRWSTHSVTEAGFLCQVY